MIELSTYVLEALRKDKEFNLYRGRSKDHVSQILVLSPVVEYPAPESLKRLEYEYSLREELNPAWAARPMAIARHWNRMVLALEDPGGVPIDQLRWSTIVRRDPSGAESIEISEEPDTLYAVPGSTIKAGGGLGTPDFTEMIQPSDPSVS